MILDGEKILVTKMKKKDFSYYVLPGGGVEMDETIFEAVRREVKEETGLNILRLRLVYIKELKNEKLGRGVEFYFYVEKYDGILKKGFDPEEKESVLEDVDFLKLSELNKVVFYPEELKDRISVDKEHGFSSLAYLGLKEYTP